MEKMDVDFFVWYRSCLVTDAGKILVETSKVSKNQPPSFDDSDFPASCKSKMG